MNTSTPDNQKPEISIIILAWKLIDNLENCLKSIEKSKNPPRYEVIIVNNGADEDVSDYLKKLENQYSIVHLSKNVGFGQACNAGVLIARGRNVLFLNDDCFIDKHFLNKISEHAKNNPSFGAIACLLINSDDTIQEAGSKILSSGGTLQIGAGLSLDNPRAKMLLHEREIDYGSAAALLVDKKSFIHIGGFDPIYEPAYFEDVDLCLSLKAMGKKVIFVPDAVATHISGGSTSQLRRFREFAGQKAGIAFSKKWEKALVHANQDELSTISNLSVIEMPSRSINKKIIKDSFKIHLEIKDEYISWLENQIAQYNPFDYEVSDELAQTREELAAVIVQRNHYGDQLHLVTERLNDLESRNFLQIIKWQIGKKLKKR